MIEKEKTPFVKRGDTLVCFGDSLTEAAPGYVRLLEDALTPLGIRIVNAGRGGDKTPAALTRLEKDVTALHPSAVSIFFGNNDAVIGRGAWRDEPVVSPLTFQENLCWMIHLCRNAGIRNISINTMTGEMEGPLLKDFGFCRNDYCQAARRAADWGNAVLVPLDAVFSNLKIQNASSFSDDGLRYTFDGLHMNKDGYQLIADTMLKEWNLSTLI